MKLSLIVLGAVAAMTATGLAQSPAPSPDPAALFAQARAASGGDAWNGVAEIAMRGTFSGQGFNGPFVSFTDLRTGESKTTMTIGGTTQAQGFDAGGAWQQQDRMVEPVEDAGGIAAARSGAYVARNGWWNPQDDPATFASLGKRTEGGVTYDVVRVVPKGGDPLDVWFDPSTHLIAKIVDNTAMNVPQVTAFSDFRPVNGVLYPFALSVGNGNAKYDMRFVAQSVTFEQTLTASDIERPKNSRNGSIANGNSTTVPIDLDNPIKGHIVVLARINGSRPLHLIFDTGGSNALSPEAAKEIGLKGSGNIGVNGAGQTEVSVQLASGARLQIGAATLPDQQVAIVPLPPSLAGIVGRYRIDGLIGYEVLKNFVVAIDYVHRTMTLSDPGTFHYAGGGAPVRFKSATIPVIPATIDGVTGDFMVDTGNAFYNTLSQTFLKTHGLDARLPGTVLVQSSGNLGGAFRSRLVRAATLAVGPYRAAGTIFAVDNNARGSLAGTAFAGNFGEALLSRFDLTFDYAHGTIYMKPNANFAQPFVGSRTGMSVYRPDPTHLEAGYVNPGSPAAKAGIATGDRILAVDGVPVAKFGPGDLIALESHAKTIAIEYVHAGTTRTSTIVLTEMVP